MSEKISIDPKTTALLLMDFQRFVVENYSTDNEALLTRAAKLLEAARSDGLVVTMLLWDLGQAAQR